MLASITAFSISRISALYEYRFLVYNNIIVYSNMIEVTTLTNNNCVKQT